jgi:hypothetical protein
MFDALFLHGNSAQNIRDGDAFEGHKEKIIAKAVFGEGPKIRADLGETVYKSYGIAQEGFNISSCQFALHYFFENVRTMHNFVRNVAECTRVGGIFTGTCWDGKTVFNLLRNKPCGDAFTIGRYGVKLFQITKMYDYTAFPDTELSLGYSISVFQESIGQHIVEYLVNFEFFRRVMENYGFVLLNREEATQFGFPNGGTGMFDGLYYDMMASVHREPTHRYGTAPEMTEDEKFISFLNRYFIFRKVRHVSAERITKTIEDTMPSVEATKCNSDRAIVAPVVYGSPDEPEQIAKSFEKREELAKRAAKKGVKDNKPQASAHFIRPFGDHQITIRAFNPPTDNEPGESSVAVEVRELQMEEGPAMQLVPKAAVVPKAAIMPKAPIDGPTDAPKKVVRVGNTVRINKKVSIKNNK